MKKTESRKQRNTNAIVIWSKDNYIFKKSTYIKSLHVKFICFRSWSPISSPLICNMYNNLSTIFLQSQTFFVQVLYHKLLNPWMSICWPDAVLLFNTSLRYCMPSTPISLPVRFNAASVYTAAINENASQKKISYVILF